MNKSESSEKVIFEKIKQFLDDDKDVGKENANYVRSISVLEHLIIEEISKSYMFNEIYKDIPLIKELHEVGLIYHHQLSKLSPYCIGLSSYDVALKGLRSTATNERSSKPPKRLDTLFSQCANLICLLAQEVSGATSVNDLSTVAAGYLFHLEKSGKKISDYEIKNIWQSFLYNINLPFRAGNSPFSNITLDFSKPNPTIANKTIVVGGQYISDYCYKDIPPEYFDRINKGFIDAMIEGDSIGNPFTFPLITINIDDNFDHSNPIWKYFLQNSDKFGGFYAQNYCSTPFTEEARKINPYHEPYNIGMLYSNCCRMIFNIKELLGVTGCNPFASNSGVGGIGVITINLNLVFWLANGKIEKIKEILDKICNISAEALETKRKWVRENWKKLFPYLSFYIKDDKTLFSIISVCGAHEGLISIGFENGIYDKEGQKLIHEIAMFLRKKLDELSNKYNSVFSLEYAPIETAACVLAAKSLKAYQELSKELFEKYKD